MLLVARCLTRLAHISLFILSAAVGGIKRPLEANSRGVAGTKRTFNLESGETMRVTTEVQLYRIIGKMKGSRNCKGVRQEVYRQASLVGAWYGCDTEEASIHYTPSYAAGNGYSTSDLQFELLFPSVEATGRFVGMVHDYLERHRFLLEDGYTMFEGPTAEVHDLSQLQWANSAHYTRRKQAEVNDHVDGQSPACDSILSATTVVDLLNDPGVMLQSLEDPNLLAREKLKLFACHILPKARKKHDNEASNRLYMSEAFRNYYNGTMTFEQAPYFAVRFLGRGERLAVIPGSPILKTRIWVELECRFVDSMFFESRLKPEAEKIGENKWKTFIWVDSPEITEECLNVKYDLTMQAWAEYEIQQQPLGDADVDELLEDVA